MAGSDLIRRVGVAAVGIPVVLGLLWWGGWPLGMLVAAAASLSAWEFYRLAEVRGGRPFSGLGTLAAGALVLFATALPQPFPYGVLSLGLVLAVALLAMAGAIWLRWPGGEPLEAVGTTVLGVLYTGATLAFVPLLRSAWPLTGPPDPALAGADDAARLFGVTCVLLPLLATWAGDSAAYFGGRAWGRVKLAPVQSPGKSVEGALVGLVGSVVAAVIVSLWMPAAPWTGGLTPPLAGLVGLALGVAGQLGDLAESVLKRQAGVKDSGHLLPGHGGMLDRLDSLFFAIPLTWALLVATGVIRLSP